MASLIDAYARLERADEHLQKVNEIAKAICTAQSEATKVQISQGKTLALGELGQIFMVESANTPITDRLRVLIGDSVNSLRSCLDYLVGELAELNSGSGKRRTQFPVEQSLDAFNNRRQTFLKDVSEAHVEYIEALQPYNGISWTDKLSRISNWDKHNKLVLVAHDYILGGSTTPRGDMFGNAEVQLQIEMSLQPSLRVELEGGFQLIESLDEVRTGVANTLEHFKPKF